MERILLVVLLGLLVYLVYLVFAPFLVALAWAVVLTIMFFPVHRAIRKRLRWPNLSALVSTLLLAGLILGPGLLILGAFTGQAIDAVRWFQQEWQEGRVPFGQFLGHIPIDRILDWLADHNIPVEDWRAFVTDKLQRLAGFLAGQAGRLARNVLSFLFTLFVTLFATFYLFRDGPALYERLRRALPLSPTHRDQLLNTAQDTLYASLFSGFVVAGVQGTMGGITFWALGIGAPVLWGIIMAFLSLLPVLGAWIVWVPACIFLLLQGEYLKATILFGVGAGVIGLTDNFLRPVLVSGRAQLNGLLVFVSILGGVIAFGLLGIILGPIVVAVGSAVVKSYTTEELIPPPEEA
ncbi:AI-2E family transporter [Acidobacteriia bacterium AH_259_A11_L15]|nr:AI-2E family transporter [Acidobacteriia bacterium AH_259_A11_L15]